MKKDVARFVEIFFECQRVKVEHQHPIGLLQPKVVPEWKWHIINMEYIQVLPMYRNQNNSILVVVDRITKVTNFIPRNLIDGAPIITHKCVQEIFRIHGVSKKIISNMDARMTSRF